MRFRLPRCLVANAMAIICLFERLRDAVPASCSWWSCEMRLPTLPLSGTVTLHEWIGAETMLDCDGEHEGGEEQPALHLSSTHSTEAAGSKLDAKTPIKFGLTSRLAKSTSEMS